LLERLDTSSQWVYQLQLQRSRLAVVVEIAGGLALIVGYQTRIAAFVLAVFTFVASVLFHAYWAVPADQAFVTQLLFFKNVAVIGGLLALAASGTDKFSIEGLKAKQK
jgi:putative oxidoreductase